MDEVRITSTTGGEKGQKDDRQDLIDPWFLQELGLVCGFGAKKYSDDNWRRGYSWKLSIGAMLRHTYAWLRGEHEDPESGLSHLAHVAWHCMVLFTFNRKREVYGEFDDRSL